MSFKRHKYLISSNLILLTFAIGLVNLFIYDFESNEELVTLVILLGLRYLLFILIKRRFKWSKYLLLAIIAKTLYRLIIMMPDTSNHFMTKVNVLLQVILSLMVLIILFVMPKLRKHRNARKDGLNTMRYNQSGNLAL